MTAQEIKKNMTAGEWVVSAVNGADIHTAAFEPIVQCRDWGYENACDRANAAAITTAVNATYGAGIDPACVGEMIKMLEAIKNDKMPRMSDLTSLLDMAKLTPVL